MNNTTTQTTLRSRTKLSKSIEIMNIHEKTAQTIKQNSNKQLTHKSTTYEKRTPKHTNILTTRKTKYEHTQKTKQ